MPFQKGHKINQGDHRPHKRDLFTSEIIQQMDELVYKQNQSGLPLTEAQHNFKHRIVRNLLMRAACLGDEYDADGNLTKQGLGDLQAIVALMDRIEGRPKQQVTGPDDGPVQVQYKTLEEVHMYLLSRGIDALRVPPPRLKLVESK